MINMEMTFSNYEAPKCETKEMNLEGMLCASVDPVNRGFVDYGDEYDF